MERASLDRQRVSRQATLVAATGSAMPSILDDGDEAWDQWQASFVKQAWKLETLINPARYAFGDWRRRQFPAGRRFEALGDLRSAFDAVLRTFSLEGICHSDEPVQAAIPRSRRGVLRGRIYSPEAFRGMWERIEDAGEKVAKEPPPVPAYTDSGPPPTSRRGGRRRKMDEACEFAAAERMADPDIDDEAIVAKWNRGKTQARRIKAKQLQNAESYRRRKNAR